MLVTQQSEIAQKYGLLPFDVLALEPIRTLCEKIMSLVRFSYDENPINALQFKIRHTYDLYFLLKNREIKNFFDSTAFEEMLLKVANDDVVSFKNNNQWLQHHPVDALIFNNPKVVWEKLKSTYNGRFKDLVYGILPEEKEILATLHLIQKRIEKIPWSLSL